MKNIFSIKNFDKISIKIFWSTVLVAIIGLSGISHYGITWDEQMNIDMVKWNLEYLRDGDPLSEHFRHHGFIFNYTSNLIYELQYGIKKSLFPSTSLNKQNFRTTAERNFYILKEKTRVKHVVTFLLSLLTYVSVAGLVFILTRSKLAWLGVFILALFPRFWGHSFFNPKDIPFATLFTLGTFLGVRLVNYYFGKEDQVNQIGLNKITVYSLLYGIAIGLATGVRIAGFFLLFFFLIAHLSVKSNLKDIYLTLIRFSKFYLIIFIAWTITTIAVYPASWSNPVKWFYEAVFSLSKYSVWDNTALFNGQQIPGRSLPWYYLPSYLLMTIPVLFQISFIVGLIWLILKYNKLNPTQKACAILVILQIFTLPLIAIIKQSTMYDEIRHFLFIIPGIAVLATTALIWFYQSIANKYIKLFLATLLTLYLISIGLDMAAFHPYEYTYFNRTYGGLKAAHRQQETDYWGLSLKEGMEWLNKNAQPNSTILVAGPIFAAQAFADRFQNFTIIHRDYFAWGKDPDPDYYLAISRYDYLDFFPQCPVVYSVIRQDTPLGIVKHCNKK